jgi:hypothetical protein
MGLRLEDRRRIEAIPLATREFADWLERVGVSSLVELADWDPHALRLAIVERCAGVQVDAQLVRLIHNALTAARRLRNRQR